MELKNLRIEFGLSQTELAEKLNTTQRNVCNWEGGKYEPDFAMLIKIAEFFDVSTDYLLGVDYSRQAENISPIDKELIARIKNLSNEKKQALKILLKDF